jgi:hypothetical protein
MARHTLPQARRSSGGARDDCFIVLTALCAEGPGRRGAADAMWRHGCGVLDARARRGRDATDFDSVYSSLTGQNSKYSNYAPKTLNTKVVEQV